MPTKPLTPYETFLKQVNKRELNAADFARDMNYSYNHSAMMYRGEVQIGYETLGRLLVIYGPEFSEQIASAIRAQDDIRLKKLNGSK